MNKNSTEQLVYKVDMAAYYIGTFLRFWGRVPVRDFKEKYGTVRVYCSLGWYSLHDIFYPGYAYNQFPNWLSKFDIYFGYKLLKYTGISFFSHHCHKFLYRFAYKQAIKKYPEIKKNILCYADYDDLLEGL